MFVLLGDIFIKSLVSSLIFFDFKKFFVEEKDDEEEGKEEESLPEVEPTEQDEEGYAVIYDSQSSLKLQFCEDL